MCHITVAEYNKGIHETFNPVSKLDTVEDVATLVETFEKARMEISVEDIVDVVVNGEGFYLFVTGREEGEEEFDFYKYINSKYENNTEVNCVNVRFLFPVNLSRGIFSGVLTSDLSEEETPTGFLDEDEIEGIVHQPPKFLYYVKLGVKIPLSEEGIVIGRSSQKSQYIIKGNGNVSRKHAKVYRKGNSYFVHNYEPPNGTYIDGLKIKNFDDVRLEVGSTLLLADEEFRLCD